MDFEKDFDKFAGAIGTVAEVFGKELTIALTTAYMRTLERFSMQEVESAFGKAMTTMRFFPKPVELIELITGSVGDIAEIEAAKVLEAIKRNGGNASVVFDNATSQAVIVQAFGGWVKMCRELMASDEKWFMKDFIRTYQAYARQGIEHRGHLAGHTEIQNSAANFTKHLPAPVLVGDVVKAKQIANTGPAQKALPPRAEILIKKIGDS